MVRHILLVKFNAQASVTVLAKLEQDFYRLKADIRGIEGIEFGTNNSPESLNQGYSHAILMTFTDLAARDAYLIDPFHEQLKTSFVPLIADIIVLDYQV